MNVNHVVCSILALSTFVYATFNFQDRKARAFYALCKPGMFVTFNGDKLQCAWPKPPVPRAPINDDGTDCLPGAIRRDVPGGFSCESPCPPDMDWTSDGRCYPPMLERATSTREPLIPGDHPPTNEEIIRVNP